MSDNVFDDATGAATDDLDTDPTALAARDGVEHVESSYEHEDADHCEAGYAGRAILGIEAEQGVLLLRHVEHPALVLPNGLVEEGADHVATAREFASEALGLDIRVTGVERVRSIEHTVDGEPVDHTTHVVLRTTVAGGTLDVHDDDWTGEWTGELPEDEMRGDTLDDARLFF